MNKTTQPYKQSLPRSSRSTTYDLKSKINNSRSTIYNHHPAPLYLRSTIHKLRSGFTLSKFKLNASKGFTLIEVLIVVAIIALLVIALTMSMRTQRERAEDARAKSDLERLRISFEDYYSDNSCCPPPEWFDGAEDCSSDALQPYLASIPCDRRTGLPYALDYPDDQCSSFALYGSLSYADDFPCSESGSQLGNYGVASSNLVVTAYCGPTATPTSTPSGPTPTPGQYACQNTTCNNFGTQANAESQGCVITFNNWCGCPTEDTACLSTSTNLCFDSYYQCN